MESEGLVVSKREEKRYRLLQQVLRGKLALAQVASALGVSYRHAKRLKGKVAGEGLRGIVHGNRGRPPANKRPPELRMCVLELSREKYGDFNDTHFTEQLAEREGIVISRELVRRWRREAGMRPKCKRRVRKHHKRRPRERAAGLMMLWDGSPHRWFGEEHPPCCLLTAVDDARGEALASLFLSQECSWGYLELLRQVVTTHGVPASVYQDRHSALRRNDDHWSIEEELAGEREPTQVGAALADLVVEPIFALSPQAKGRVERLFRTFQDRLVAELRLAGITTIQAANAFLPGFLARYNQRFGVPAADPITAWRKPPSPATLERLLSLRYQATVGHDNAVRLDGMVIDIPPGPGGRGYARARVDVHQLLDGRWRIYYQHQLIAETQATEISELIRTRRRRKGVPAAHDYRWVFMGSAPPRDHSADRIKHKSLSALRQSNRDHGFRATRLG